MHALWLARGELGRVEDTPTFLICVWERLQAAISFLKGE